LTGTGTLSFGSGTTEVTGNFNLSGTANLASSATVAFNAAARIHTLTQSGGTLAGTANLAVTGPGGQLNWTGGTMSGTGTTTIAAGTTLTINGAPFEILDSRT